MTTKKRHPILYFAKNLSVIVGIVFIWRGTWYILDAIDVWVFGGSHVWTAVAGVLVGLFILYIPDRDLKEIEQL